MIGGGFFCIFCVALSVGGGGTERKRERERERGGFAFPLIATLSSSSSAVEAEAEVEEAPASLERAPKSLLSPLSIHTCPVPSYCPAAAVVPSKAAAAAAVPLFSPSSFFPPVDVSSSSPLFLLSLFLCSLYQNSQDFYPGIFVWTK